MYEMITFLSILFGGKIRDFFNKEDGAVDIVAIVVLIGIAVILAILFKDAITGLLNNMFGTIEQNATNAIS